MCVFDVPNYILGRKLEEKRLKCKEAINTTEIIKKENNRIKMEVNERNCKDVLGVVVRNSINFALDQFLM